MDKRTKNVVIASVALGAAAVSVYFAVTGGSQKVNLDPYSVLGTVTAEETAKLLGGKGQVLVIVRDTGANINPSVEAELKAFQQTLKKHAGLSVLVEKFRVTPMLMMATGGGLPTDELFKALEIHRNLGAVVLFLGFPSLTNPEIDALKKTGVKTVAVSSLRPGYKRLLERQAIQAAIVPKPDAPPPGGPTPRTVRERFDQQYRILTPADAARLP
jgi:hypothetical protein